MHVPVLSQLFCGFSVIPVTTQADFFGNCHADSKMQEMQGAENSHALGDLWGEIVRPRLRPLG